MKRWKKATALIILPLFLLQGCGVWMSDRGTVIADKPYETTDSGAQRSAAPYETSEPKLVKTETGQETTQESFVPAHWEIVDYAGILPGSYPYPKFDADPVWKMDKTKPNTFKAIEDYAKKNGLAILKTVMDFPAKMTSGHKPPKIYLIPKGKYILYKPKEQANGDVLLTPVEVPSCRNQLVLAPQIKWVPRTKIKTIVRVDKEIWVTTERYVDTKTVVERYRDVNTQVDIGAVALGALGGLLVGVGLGYLFWFGSGATTIISGPVAGPIPCPPGGPGPVPIVP